MGKYGFGNKNDRGALLLYFCVQMNMIITNTFYLVPDRRQYTWKAPGDVRRYQIDSILIKRKYRNQVKSSHTYPGRDVDSDHNLVLAKCNGFQVQKKTEND